MKKTYTVIDEAGLHARPASLLTQVAGKYDNSITIQHSDKCLTLKSIMAVMSLGIPQNASFTIEVDGDNALDILTELEAILVEHKVI